MSKYDPTKRYFWEKSQIFQFTGEEYAVLLNSIRSMLSTPEAQRIIGLYKAHEILDNILKNAVENDLVKSEEQNETKS